MSIQKYLELRRLVDVLYDVQDVRMRTANRLRQMPKDTVKIYVKPLLDVEKQLTNQIDAMLQDEPVYKEFLGHVRGVGPRISGSIIAQTMIRFERISKEEYEKAMNGLGPTSGVRANPCLRTISEVRFSEEQLNLAQKTEKGDYLVPTLRGIGAFDTVSKYWAWWGYDVRNGEAPKRKKGELVDWNPKMRMLGWKIEKQFVMQGEGYRTIYEKEKERLQTLRPTPQDCPNYEKCKAKLKKREQPACKGHIEKMARRKTVKLFLSHLWEKWRQIEGLPVRQPYIIEKLGHTTKITEVSK